MECTICTQLVNLALLTIFRFRFCRFVCRGPVGTASGGMAFHWLGLFQLPPQPEVWTLLLVNGFIGTVLSELLWLW